MNLFAENAWLGPGRQISRALVRFGPGDVEIQTLPGNTSPPPDAQMFQWLLPGFVNAHCHLEYSSMAGRLPRGSVPFGEWITAVNAARPKSSEELEERNATIESAARDLLAGGCTTIIDSTTDATSGVVLANNGIRHFLFHEVLGLQQHRAEPMWNRAVQQLQAKESPWLLGHGLNAHAPYSVSSWLQEKLREAPKEIPQAWHLAETQDEEQLFLTGEGSIANFLRANNLPPPYIKCPGISSWNFLQQEGLLEHCDMAFHGNCLTPDEARFFKAPRGLVHCPGTHRWFDRKSVPLKEWLKAGVNVCLGTDSLASSESLSMLEMVRIVLEDHPEITAEEVLQMACSNPGKIPFVGNAAAMGDFVALDTPVKSADAREVLSSRGAMIKQVWISGVERL